jgi:hypothetical protein
MSNHFRYDFEFNVLNFKSNSNLSKNTMRFGAEYFRTIFILTYHTHAIPRTPPRSLDVTFMVARHPHGYRRLRASSTRLPLI